MCRGRYGAQRLFGARAALAGALLLIHSCQCSSRAQLPLTLARSLMSQVPTAAAVPGMVNCSCGKTGKCTNCKCAKAGRRCNSNCGCSRFSMCTNMEEMEAVDKAVLEVDEMNVALTRSELASK